MWEQRNKDDSLLLTGNTERIELLVPTVMEKARAGWMGKTGKSYWDDEDVIIGAEEGEVWLSQRSLAFWGPSSFLPSREGGWEGVLPGALWTLGDWGLFFTLLLKQ